MEMLMEILGILPGIPYWEYLALTSVNIVFVPLDFMTREYLCLMNYHSFSIVSYDFYTL